MLSLCRFCAQKKKNGELVTNLQNVSEMYRRICPQYDSKLSHQLPQQICGPCCDQLLNCWNFIEQIESAEKQLTEMIINKSEKTIPAKEVIFCENSIIIFEPKVELLAPLDMKNVTQEAETPRNESDTEQIDEEDEMPYESDTESNREVQNNQGEQIDEEIKRQEYNLNRKRRRMKYVKFFSELPRHMILADGSISNEAVSLLKKSYPEMTTISWATCKYKCDKCPEIIEGTNQFFIHFQSKHFEELDSYRFPCYNCNDVHDSLFKLNRHIATQHYIHLRYCCSMCPEMYFWNLTVLDKHQKSHPRPRFKCHLCNKTGLYNLAQHIRYTHLVKEKPEKFEKYICDICQAECISKGRIKSHMVKHSMTKNHICHCCAQRFSTKAQLNAHIDAVHTVSEVVYTCPIENCGKQFSTVKRFKSHTKIHEEPKFKCNICTFTTLTKTSLRNHQLIHDDKRPHKCRMCEKTFRLSQSKRVHERIHTGETPYKCPNCPYSTADWGNLEKHTKRIHSISMKKGRTTIKHQSQGGPGVSSNQ